MSVERLDAIVPPHRFTLDGTTVTIWEVIKLQLVSGDTMYHVLVELSYKGKRSQRFPLDARDWKDLLKKLLVEIPKFKLAVLMGYVR